MKTAMTLLWSSKGAASSFFRAIRSSFTASGERLSWSIGISLTVVITITSIFTYKPVYLWSILKNIGQFNEALSSDFQGRSEQSSIHLTQEELDESGLNKSLFEFNPEHEAYPETYSFKYTSLGFGVKDLKFIQEMPKDQTEQKVLNLIPKKFRKKARIYIKPVLILSEKYQVDPLWVLSVMWTESHFKPTAISHVGAKGLMQIMPGTKKYLLKKLRNSNKKLVVQEKSFNINNYFPERNNISNQILIKKLINIELGIVYLKNLLKQFNYNHRYATVAYNMGPGWTLKRLRRNQPVGVKNEYLEKVSIAYETMVTSI